MPSDLSNLTPRQQKWFASVRASLEARTGKTLDQWVAIAKTCPHESPRARRDWLKAEHGLLQNSAAFVLGEAFPEGGGWDDAQALRDALWRDPNARAILDAVAVVARGIDAVVVGQRKGYTAFSRDVQFAAMRPVKGKGALLGLKLPPGTSGRLQPAARKESWSERLTSTIALATPGDVDGAVAELFRQASANG